MENKFVLFIIGFICMIFLCYSTGAGFGGALLDDGDNIRILSPDVKADNGGVAIYGDRNDVEYTNNPDQDAQTETFPTVKQRNVGANIFLSLVGMTIGFILLLAALSRRKYENQYLLSDRYGN